MGESGETPELPHANPADEEDPLLLFLGTAGNLNPSGHTRSGPSSAIYRLSQKRLRTDHFQFYKPVSYFLFFFPFLDFFDFFFSDFPSEGCPITSFLLPAFSVLTL